MNQKKKETLENRSQPTAGKLPKKLSTGTIHGLFKVNLASRDIEIAKNMPNPKMLFSEFWHEKELCVLFGGTSSGKSALAVQIAESITRGRPIPGFQMTAEKQKVLYFDFELNEKQLENRYSNNYKNHFRLNSRLLRVSILQNAYSPKNKTYVQYVMDSLEQTIIDNKVNVVIIDNITFLVNTTSARLTGNLMGELKALKEKYGLSLLVLAHTSKKKKNLPLTVNDIMGSSMTGNFMDSSFAIGKSSNQDDIRYIKQIKERMTEKIYGEDNVCVCRLCKPNNFLKFEFVEYGEEDRYLKKTATVMNNDDLVKQVLQRHEQGMTLREIGFDLGINHMKVSRILKRNGNGK